MLAVNILFIQMNQTISTRPQGSVDFYLILDIKFFFICLLKKAKGVELTNENTIKI